MDFQDEACVFEANGEPLAQQVRAFLEANGIESVLRGESTRLTHGFTLDGLGVVRVCVLAENAERARELLAQADAGQLMLDPPAEPGNED